ncbi:MAG: peptidase M22 [Clostridiales bacterium]|nr:peptidase M22 [Clostridiales bacterium]
MKYLGIDTSNYTTSAAVYDSGTGLAVQKKKLLPVKKGERGLRQSDALFHHTVQLPEVTDELFGEVCAPVDAVGVSVSPTTRPGSYMPCFLAGVAAAKTLCAASGIPLYTFSHQQGHIAAALYSAGKTELINERFIAFHVSGGATDVLLVSPDEDRIILPELIASSSDLKAGQAVDRTGVALGLDFPAGAALDALARQSKRTFNIKVKLVNGCCSLSGLENKCMKMISDGEAPEDVARMCIEYIAAALSAMTEAATAKYGSLPLVYSGGVMSNSIIRERFAEKYKAYFAQPDFSCDNAAGTAYLAYLKGSRDGSV